MPQSVERVVGERERNEHLGRDFKKSRPSSEGGRHARALEVPSEGWCDEVREAKDVEAAAEDGACDAVECGAVPGYLWAVDGEMGCDGAVEALFCEDLRGGFFGGDGLCCGESSLTVYTGCDGFWSSCEECCCWLACGQLAQ